MSIEFVVVEDDKLQTAVNKAIDQAEAAMPSLDRRRYRSREPRGHRRRRGRQRRGARPGRRRGRPHRPLRQQDPAGRHQEGRLGHPLRALREIVPHPHPHRRRAEGSRAAARAAGGKDRRAPEGHGAARHRGAPRAAGRPHQDAAVEEPRHRLPRQHLPDAVRRKGRDPYSRSLERHAGHRRAGIRAAAARNCT